MPRYLYAADEAGSRLFPLHVGPDAVVEPADGRDAPAGGTTVELYPGDHLTTTAPVEHPLLAPVDDDVPSPAANAFPGTTGDLAEAPTKLRVPRQRPAAD